MSDPLVDALNRNTKAQEAVAKSNRKLDASVAEIRDEMRRTSALVAEKLKQRAEQSRKDVEAIRADIARAPRARQ